MPCTTVWRGSAGCGGSTDSCCCWCWSNTSLALGSGRLGFDGCAVHVSCERGMSACMTACSPTLFWQYSSCQQVWQLYARVPELRMLLSLGPGFDPSYAASSCVGLLSCSSCSVFTRRSAYCGMATSVIVAFGGAVPGLSCLQACCVSV